MEKKKFDEERELNDFFEMLQGEIDEFSKDGENREIYIHIREEFSDVEERIQRGKSVSGAEKPREQYDKNSPRKFSWVGHFWTSKANFLRIIKQLNPKITKESILSKKDREECQRTRMGNIECYRTIIPYLQLRSYRPNINTLGFSNLSQFKLHIKTKHNKRNTSEMPMDIKVNLDKISQAKKISEELEKQWQMEFSDEQWRKTSIIKLWKLDIFSETLAKKCGDRLENYGGFTIMITNEEGFHIDYIKCYGFHEGSFINWEPMSYEEVIDKLAKHFSAKNIIQNFIGEFYSTWIYIPKQWLPQIKAILQEPISEEEYEKIQDIIEKGKKKTARGWLDKAQQEAKRGYYERAEEYRKKAKSFWSKLDDSKVAADIQKEQTKDTKK